MGAIAMPGFIQECLAHIPLVAGKKVRVGLLGTLRKVFEYVKGIEQFDQLKAALSSDPRIELVTDDNIVADGIVWAGQLDNAEAVAQHFIAEKVDVVLAVCCNYGDEETMATVAKKVHKARRVPVYTFVFPDLPFEPDGRRLLDNGCGILPSRQFMRLAIGRNPGYIPTAPLDSEVFRNGLTDMLRVAGGVRAVRSVRGIQIGTDQQTFPAIEWPRAEFRRHFDTRVEPMDPGAFRQRLVDGLNHPPNWLQEGVGYVSQWIDFSDVVGEFPDTAKLTALAFGFIIETLAQKQSNCVSINCWPDIMEDPELRFMICAVNGLLYQHGIPAACETDWPGNHASAMLQGMVIGGNPAKNVVAFADWTTFYVPEGLVLFWHCGPFAPGLCRGGCKAAAKPGWIIPVPDGCAGLLHQKWGEIGDCVTFAQIRPDGQGKLTLVGYNGCIGEGPETIGSQFWIALGSEEQARKQEDFNYRNPVDHHHACMLGVNLVYLLPEVASWLGLECATTDNLSA